MEPVATKQAVALAIPMLFALPIDPLWFVLIPVALMAAWLARAARILQEGKALKVVWRDTGISLLLGASIGLLALVLITYLDLDYLWGMALAWVLAFGGMPAVTAIYTKGLSTVEWAIGHYVEERVRNDQADS